MSMPINSSDFPSPSPPADLRPSSVFPSLVDPEREGQVTVTLRHHPEPRWPWLEPSLTAARIGAIWPHSAKMEFARRLRWIFQLACPVECESVNQALL